MRKNYFKILILLFPLTLNKLCLSQTVTTPPEIKTFALNPDQKGAGANSVNLFLGDVALLLSLISLPFLTYSII